MSDPARTRMDAQAFLAWAMEQPEGERYELVHGEVVRMASERVAHARTKFKIARLLSNALGSQTSDCEVFGDGMAVVIDAGTVYEPDALLRCGPALQDDDVQIFDPIVVVEVVSPSSRRIDSNAKLEGYFRLASVRHYLVVSTDRRLVIHHRREESGAILAKIVRTGPIHLNPPGITLDGIFD